MFHKWLVALSALCLWSGTAWAGDDELVTDRPDVAESSRVVGAGRVQLEIGVDGDRGEGLSVPTKVRVGVLDMLELHLESGVLSLTSAGLSAAPLEVGGKVHLFGGESTSVGLLVALEIPWEGAPLVLSPTLAIDQDLTDSLGLGINLGVDLGLTDRAKVQDALRWAAALGLGLGDQWGVYVEGFGEVAFAGGVGVSMDAGGTFLATPWLQLDAYVRAGGIVGGFNPGVGLGASIKW